MGSKGASRSTFYVLISHHPFTFLVFGWNRKHHPRPVLSKVWSANASGYLKMSNGFSNFSMVVINTRKWNDIIRHLQEQPTASSWSSPLLLWRVKPGQWYIYYSFSRPVEMLYGTWEMRDEANGKKNENHKGVIEQSVGGDYRRSGRRAAACWLGEWGLAALSYCGGLVLIWKDRSAQAGRSHLATNFKQISGSALSSARGNSTWSDSEVRSDPNGKHGKPRYSLAPLLNNARLRRYQLSYTVTHRVCN